MIVHVNLVADPPFTQHDDGTQTFPGYDRCWAAACDIVSIRRHITAVVEPPAPVKAPTFGIDDETPKSGLTHRLHTMTIEQYYRERAAASTIHYVEPRR